MILWLAKDRMGYSLWSEEPLFSESDNCWEGDSGFWIDPDNISLELKDGQIIKVGYCLWPIT